MVANNLQQAGNSPFKLGQMRVGAAQTFEVHSVNRVERARLHCL
jgi:hypothetical protein